MAMNSPLRLHGIYPPITTPFHPDESLALDRLRANLEKYNRTPIAGYVVGGSTGEAVHLTRDELDRVWAAARESSAPDKILIAGTGVDTTAETVSRTNRAAQLGYHVALVKTPHYYRPQMTDDVLVEHYLRVADAARIPILIYSVRQFTGVAVEAPLVARLSGHPNILGIKESSGNVARVAEMIRAAPREFQTLVGAAGTLYPSIAAGAVGAVLALACALPEQCVELYNLARAGDASRAAAWQQRLAPAATALTSGFGIAGLKYALDQLGYYGGPPRRPLLPVDPAARREIDAILASVAASVSPSS